jgi:divalent metal cation (Fe/Co/Zn/Cd) transporter
VRIDAASSLVVPVALVLVQAAGAQRVVSTIVVTGLRLLVRAGEVRFDQALPADEPAAIAHVIERFADRDVVGIHELRTRCGGSQRYVDVHIQFRKARRSSRPTAPRTSCRTRPLRSSAAPTG